VVTGRVGAPTCRKDNTTRPKVVSCSRDLVPRPALSGTIGPLNWSVDGAVRTRCPFSGSFLSIRPL
jgi:hypothetical protein